jgi:hypothetical protein
VYEGEEDAPFFIFGLSTVPWVPEGTAIGTTTSVLPSSLADASVNASIAFDDVNDGVYAGPRAGSRQDILDSICTVSAWNTSDSINYPTDDLRLFQVFPEETLTSAPTPSPTPAPTLAPSSASEASEPSAAPTSVASEKTNSNGGGDDEGSQFGTLSDKEFTILVVCLIVTVVALAASCWYLRRRKGASGEELRRSIYEISNSLHRHDEISSVAPPFKLHS